MTKEVLLSITGLQLNGIVEDDQVEVITPGEYYNQNNKHFVLFDEVNEENREKTKNTIKIQNNMVDLIKKGFVNVHMVFEENKKNMTYYNTPFGNIIIGINTEKIALHETEEKIDVKINYALEVNYEFVADCKINISIKSKASGQTILS